MHGIITIKYYINYRSKLCKTTNITIILDLNPGGNPKVYDDAIKEM